MAALNFPCAANIQKYIIFFSFFLISFCIPILFGFCAFLFILFSAPLFVRRAFSHVAMRARVPELVFASAAVVLSSFHSVQFGNLNFEVAINNVVYFQWFTLWNKIRRSETFTKYVLRWLIRWKFRSERSVPVLQRQLSLHLHYRSHITWDHMHYF